MRPSDGMKAGLLLSLSLVCRVLKLISSWHFSWTWRRKEGKSVHSVSKQIQQRKQKSIKKKSHKNKSILKHLIHFWDTDFWLSKGKFVSKCRKTILILRCIFFWSRKLCRSDSKPWVVCGHSGSLWSPPVSPACHLRSSLGFGSAAKGRCDGSIPAAEGREEARGENEQTNVRWRGDVMNKYTKDLNWRDPISPWAHMMKSFACFELTSLASFS